MMSNDHRQTTDRPQTDSVNTKGVTSLLCFTSCRFSAWVCVLLLHDKIRVVAAAYRVGGRADNQDWDDEKARKCIIYSAPRLRTS